eukprot:c11557_g1_i1.p1 GENE.c11557_g1_i1~~c11557_g1_i1.p1  ORF type:complete len:608 (+),score=110.38 c11557_g1_i1:92-1915(+)
MLRFAAFPCRASALGLSTRSHSILQGRSTAVKGSFPSHVAYHHQCLLGKQHHTRISSFTPNTSRHSSSSSQSSHHQTPLVSPSAKHDFIPVPPPAATSSTRVMFSVREFALYSGILGFAAVLFHGLQYPEHSLVPAEFVDIPAPAEEFRHPFESSSIFFQTFVRMKRFFYLSFLFVPCACAGLMVHFTNDEKWREYFLGVLVRTFENAGCGFQKFGQWISMRPDMFPADIVHAMSKLRQNIPPHAFHHTRRMVRESFGAEIDELFDFFDETPVASGTVAQVHHARLRPEHAIRGHIRDVAVKVRHPSVLEETFADIEFLFHILDNTPFMTMPFCKDQFLTSLRKQVNFEWEAHALSKFARNFKDEAARGEVNFPLVSTSLLSPSVLVESWVSGSTISNFFTDVGEGFKVLVGNSTAQINATLDLQKHELAESIFGVCMKMFLRDNYMHGDLHAGNVIYDANSRVLTVLDAGHTTSLSSEAAAHFGEFLGGMCLGDADKIVKALITFHDKQHSTKPVDVDGLRKDVNAAVKRWVGPDGRAPDGSPVCVGDLMGEIFFNLNRNNVSLRGDVAISLVSIAVSEGLIRQLAPDFDMNKKALPYIARFATIV